MKEKVMKFYVRFQEDSTLSRTYKVPTIVELVEQTSEYLDELQKKEKIIDHGFFGIGHGFYAIFNVRNNAELHELTEFVPIRPFCTLECAPVLESTEFADSFGKIKKEMLTQWKKNERHGEQRAES
jgi:hypothetical protein